MILDVGDATRGRVLDLRNAMSQHASSLMGALWAPRTKQSLPADKNTFGSCWRFASHIAIACKPATVDHAGAHGEA